MIETLELRNFKSHLTTFLEFGRLTALVGPNGAGKTSVLEAINQVAERTFAPQAVDPRKDGPLRRGTTMMEIKLGPTGNAPEPGKLIGCRLLKLSAEKLAEPSYFQELQPAVDGKGRFLATVLATLKNSDEKQFLKIVQLTQEVVPSLQTVGIRRAKVPISETRFISVDGKEIPWDEKREMIGEELVFTIAGVPDIPASAVSEGTLLALGLITILSAPDRPNLILLDDIEQGLHPKAQRCLVDVLKRIQDLPGNEELQIVFTTHSPYVVDEMDPKDVWVLAMDEAGVTVAKRLSDHPEVQEDEGVLSTGELWSALGEDWVLDRDGSATDG